MYSHSQLTKEGDRPLPNHQQGDQRSGPAPPALYSENTLCVEEKIQKKMFGNGLVRCHVEHRLYLATVSHTYAQELLHSHKCIILLCSYIAIK